MMEYPILKRLKPYAVLLGIGIPIFLSNTTYSNAATTQEAMKVLKVRNPALICHLPNGYKTLKGLDGTIRLLAGGAEIEKLKNGWLCRGKNRIVTNEKVVEIAREADTNWDEIVTNKELLNLVERLYEEGN